MHGLKLVANEYRVFVADHVGEPFFSSENGLYHQTMEVGNLRMFTYGETLSKLYHQDVHIFNSYILIIECLGRKPLVIWVQSWY